MKGRPSLLHPRGIRTVCLVKNESLTSTSKSVVDSFLGRPGVMCDSRVYTDIYCFSYCSAGEDRFNIQTCHVYGRVELFLLISFRKAKKFVTASSLDVSGRGVGTRGWASVLLAVPAAGDTGVTWCSLVMVSGGQAARQQLLLWQATYSTKGLLFYLIIIFKIP